MCVDKADEQLLEKLSEIANLGDKLVIDITTIYRHVGKKRSEKSIQTFRFTLLNATLSREAQLAIPTAVDAHLTVKHLTEAHRNDSIDVTIFEVDYPLLDELDVRISAAIGFVLGYSPDDVVIFIEDGAGVENTADEANGVVGTTELLEIGDLYEQLLASDERESVPSPVLSAIG